MRYIITGGAGFIGSCLSNRLVDEGHEVFVFDDLRFGDSARLNSKVNLEVINIENREMLLKKMLKVDGLFHLAAFSRSGPSFDKGFETFNSNVSGLINILDGCLKFKIPKVIFAGSATFYGNNCGINRISDLPDFLNMYALSKGVGELLMKQYFRNYGLRYNILRYFNVYGPNQPSLGEYALVIGIFIENKKLGKSLEIHGSGNQKRDFIHVNDVVEATVRAMNSEVHSNTFNVGSGLSYSILDIAKMISQDIVFSERRKGDADSILADISDTKNILGWEPKISITNGISELLR